MTIPSFEELGEPFPKQKRDATAVNRIPTFDELEEKDDYGQMMQRVINRTRNIGRVLQANVELVLGKPQNFEKLYDIAAQAQARRDEINYKVSDDITNVFQNANIKESLKSLWTGAIDRVSDRKMETIGEIVKMPFHLVDSLVGDTFNATYGVDISGKEIKLLDFGEHVRSTKAFYGNAIALAATPLVSKAIAAGLELPATSRLGAALTSENIAKAPLGNVAKLGEYVPRVGAMGRAIISDVGAGAAAGVVQGGIANANTPEAYTAMAMGLMFAPIGVLTGWYRGVKMGGIGKVESAIIEAHDVSMLRQWQEISNANVESAATRFEALITSDTIEEALLKIEQAKKTAVNVGGKTYSGPGIHATIYDDALKAGADPKATVISGYETNRGRFVTADEALKLQDIADQKRAGYQGGKSIDDLYKDFEKTLTEDKSFEVSLVEYLEGKKLMPHMNELLEKFADRYIRNGNAHEMEHLDTLIKEHREAVGSKFNEGGEEIVHLANKHGFYVTNEFGRLKIRDIESGEVMGSAHTSKEAIELMKAMGKPANVLKVDSGADLPTVDFLGNTGIAPSIGQHVLDDFEVQYTNPMLRTAALDIKLNPITATSPFVEAVDRTNYGSSDVPRRTNFKHAVLEPLEKAHRLTLEGIRKNMESQEVQRIENFIRRPLDKIIGVKMDKTQLEQVALMREAQSFDEIMAPNGYSRNFTVSPEAGDLAKFLYDNHVDYTKVLTYRRTLAAVNAEFQSKAHTNALEKMTLNKKSGMSSADAVDIYDADYKAWDKSPEYAAIQQEIVKKFNPDKTFLDAVAKVDALFKRPDGAANSSAIARLKLALDHPDTHGLSRADFIKKHNITPDQVKLAEMIDDAYEHFGKKFGIKDSRMLMRYMNHYRQWADILDTDILNEFEHGITDGSMRQFASAMVRTGEIANYGTDPITALYSYIRAGTKAQHLYPVMNDIFSIDGAYSKEMAKITDPKIEDLVTRRFESYQRDITGRRSIGDTEAMHAQVHLLRNLVLDNGRKLTQGEIITMMNRPDKLDTMLHLSSSGLLGGRVSLALRDNWDVWQKFYVKHGGNRLWELVNQKATKVDIETLVERGEIANPEGVDVYNVTHSQGAAGGVSAGARELANIGFKTSLQGHYYMKNQAAVYIHTAKTANRILRELDIGKLTKEKAYEQIGIRKYEPGTQKLFDAYVRDGLFEDASRLLARDEVREIVGTFTRGNQAPVLNTRVGKLFGQLGSWSMTNRSTLQNLLTRGTKAEMRTAQIRYASTLVGTGIAGALTGLNLGRWLLLPTSLIATGGPILSNIQAIGSEAAAEAGLSERQTRFTRREAARSFKQFIPFSYAVTDVLKAEKLATEGQGYGAGRIAAQAAGVQVNVEDRSFLDWVTGNYPIPP